MKQTIVIHVIDTDSMEIHSRLFNEDNSLREEIAEDIKTNELSDHYSLEDFERAFNRSKIDSNVTYIFCEVKDVEEEIVQQNEAEVLRRVGNDINNELQR